MGVLRSDKENSSRTLGDIKLIHGGKILENSKTIGECKNPILDVAGGITTMHVVIRPPQKERGIGDFPVLPISLCPFYQIYFFQLKY